MALLRLMVCCIALLPGAVAAAPTIVLQTTVGEAALYCTDPAFPNDCNQPPNDSVQIAPGEDVAVAYSVENTGDVALATHTLVDSALGTLLNNFPFTLSPGAAVFLTQRFTAPLIPGTYPRGATWTASGGGMASSNDAYSFTVTTPELMLDVTIAPASLVCGDPDDINTCALPTSDTTNFQAGVKLVVGFQVSNVGTTAFESHDLIDDGFGTLLSDFPFSLAPGAGAFLLQFETPALPFQRGARWSAITGGGFEADSDDIYGALSTGIFSDSFE